MASPTTATLSPSSKMPTTLAITGSRPDDDYVIIDRFDQAESSAATAMFSSASCHGLLEPSCMRSSSSNYCGNNANSSSRTTTTQSTAASTTTHQQLLTLSATTHHHIHARQPKGRRGSSSTTCSGNRGLARQKRNSWMRSSVVRRAATVVDEEVAALCEKSPFLKSVSQQASLDNNSKESAAAEAKISSRGSSHHHHHLHQIALFHRMEVQLGKALGRGGFAEVYAVDAITLLDVEDSRNNRNRIATADDNNVNDDDDNTSSNHGCVDTLRRRVVEATVTSPSGRPAYAIKFLRKKLLSNTREFQHAAIDLAVEAQYLAALQDHPNIIKVHGLTRGGTSAFRTGKHDDFFIIMDHLHETLEGRIKRWQQRHHHHHHHHHHESGEPSTSTTTDTSAHHHHTTNPSRHYYHRTLRYAEQIADALVYLHDKQIVYRDLKPQNLGFKEGDVIQIFDFGLCRELPKTKGQSHCDEHLVDEETFHMSGVGTPRYMATEIILTRRYNLKADVYSWAMVVLEMMTWQKPFSEYTPEEHELNVAKWGERPRLVMTLPTPQVDDKEDGEQEHHEVSSVQTTSTSPNENNDKNDVSKNITNKVNIKTPRAKRKRANAVVVQDWPLGLANLLQDAWNQDVAARLTMQSVLEQIGPIVSNVVAENQEMQRNHDTTTATVPGAAHDHTTRSTTFSCRNNNNIHGGNYNISRTDDSLEFPSHFSPIYAMSGYSRQEQYQRQQQLQHQAAAATTTRDDSHSDCWFGDRQSDASLTMTSASTTMHDSTSTD